MLLRSAVFFALVLLAGCDSAGPDVPDAFDATFTGSVQRTLSGAYGYTLLSRYSGIGTGDGYHIELRTEPSASGVSQYGFWYSDTETVVSMGFSDPEAPSGTYEIGGRPFASAVVSVEGDLYIVQAGTVTVTQRRGRLTGTFRFTDTYHLTEDGSLSRMQVEGEFDIAPGNPTDVLPWRASPRLPAAPR